MEKIILKMCHVIAFLVFINNIYGQDTNLIDWNNLLEFRIINQEFDDYSQLPEKIDTISVLIDLEDSKKVLKKTVSSWRKCNSPGHRIGVFIFKNNNRKKIRIQGNGFIDLSDNGKFYYFKNVKRNIIEEWQTYSLRTSKEVKDSTILEFIKITNDSTYQINTRNKNIKGYYFSNSYFKTFDYLYNNLTNNEIKRFKESENTILNAAAFFILVYRNFDAKFTCKELLDLSKNNEKQMKSDKYGVKSISLAEFCFRVLIQEKESPIYKLSKKQINHLKHKIMDERK